MKTVIITTGELFDLLEKLDTGAHVVRLPIHVVVDGVPQPDYEVWEKTTLPLGTPAWIRKGKPFS